MEAGGVSPRTKFSHSYQNKRMPTIHAKACAADEEGRIEKAHKLKDRTCGRCNVELG
jgi:hypothetical protein